MAKKSLPVCPFRWTTCYGYAEKKKGKPKPVCVWWLELFNTCAITQIAINGSPKESLIE